MPQIFHRAMNPVAQASVLGAVVLAAAAAWGAYLIQRSDYVTSRNVVRQQPVQFSHEHHVSGLGIDCRYCHTAVEDSPFAGIPATETCMNCHSQIWTEAPELEPIRESWKRGLPVAWTRVHDLPDYAYFNHSIHLAKGVGCSTCHGEVDRMPLTWRTSTLHMSWCLECHRNPEKFVRPRAAVFDMDWRPPRDQEHAGGELVRAYKIENETDCDHCHR